jgi:hypothetical protein
MATRLRITGAGGSELRPCRIEAVSGQGDLLERDRAPVERREERLEPERVLVEDGKVGHERQNPGNRGR